MAMPRASILLGSNHSLLFSVVVPDFKNYLIGGFIILTATIVCCVCIYKVFKVDIVLWYRDSCSGFLPSKGIIILYSMKCFLWVVEDDE
jgi:hypothetical protein